MHVLYSMLKSLFPQLLKRTVIYEVIAQKEVESSCNSYQYNALIFAVIIQIE